MIEYIVIGDTKEYNDCLVAVLGKCTKEEADAKLNQMLTNPTENDSRLMARHSNFRIEAVSEEAQWWNDPFLAN